VDVSGIPNQIVVMPKGTETFEIFKVDDEMLYGDYITVMASAMEALNDLKEEYAMERYLKHWAQLYPEEEEEVYYRFPFRFFEEKDALKGQQPPVQGNALDK
jgi:hypothetical protein